MKCLYFVMSYMKQNIKRKQILENAQNGVEIIFTCNFRDLVVPENNHTLQKGKVMEIPKRRGKYMYECKLEFLERWKGSNQKPFYGMILKCLELQLIHVNKAKDLQVNMSG